MAKPKYRITTWDSDRQTYTPQKGVRSVRHGKWALKRAMRELRACGYSARRGPRGPLKSYDTGNDSAVLIERIS